MNGTSWFLRMAEQMRQRGLTPEATHQYIARHLDQLCPNKGRLMPDGLTASQRQGAPENLGFKYPRL